MTLILLQCVSSCLCAEFFDSWHLFLVLSITDVIVYQTRLLLLFWMKLVLHSSLRRVERLISFDFIWLFLKFLHFFYPRQIIGLDHNFQTMKIKSSRCHLNSFDPCPHVTFVKSVPINSIEDQRFRLSSSSFNPSSSCRRSDTQRCLGYVLVIRIEIFLINFRIFHDSSVLLENVYSEASTVVLKSLGSSPMSHYETYS